MATLADNKPIPEELASFLCSEDTIDDATLQKAIDIAEGVLQPIEACLCNKEVADILIKEAWLYLSALYGHDCCNQSMKNVGVLKDKAGTFEVEYSGSNVEDSQYWIKANNLLNGCLKRRNPNVYISVQTSSNACDC